MKKCLGIHGETVGKILEEFYGADSQAIRESFSERMDSEKHP